MQTKTTKYRAIIAAGLILVHAATAQAQDVEPFSVEPARAPMVDQAIYKGVVGSLLEAVPLDPDNRVQLQRTNAVVGTVASARSLALFLGVGAPAVMIGGLVWGLYAASQIKPSAKLTPPLVAAALPDRVCLDADAQADPVSLAMN